MTEKTKKDKDKLVALASIAAELHSVIDIALSVSRAGKNAKVISAQAGENGIGFRPITEQIDDISKQTMAGVDEISLAALELSKIAVHEQRSIDAYHRFDSVIEKDCDAKYIKSMTNAMQRVEESMRSSTSEFKKSMNRLTLLLESMDQCMLSARAVASVSRIVTSNASEYTAKLKVVADDLDKAASYIKQKLANSYEHLNYVNMDIKNNLTKSWNKNDSDRNI